MAAYLMGSHHPTGALEPRVAFVAEADGETIGYIGGHLTRRFDCDGELQYLYVAEAHRRSGVGAQLFERLAAWFGDHQASRVCVDVEPGNLRARGFYSALGAEPLSPYWMVWPDLSRGTEPPGTAR
jgi:GNAT superfamily N-acetyltransferase